MIGRREGGGGGRERESERENEKFKITLSCIISENQYTLSLVVYIG